MIAAAKFEKNPLASCRDIAVGVAGSLDNLGSGSSLA
jgi:hypothetical protein